MKNRKVSKASYYAAVLLLSVLCGGMPYSLAKYFFLYSSPEPEIRLVGAQGALLMGTLCAAFPVSVFLRRRYGRTRERIDY
jgi:hypothetical protein